MLLNLKNTNRILHFSNLWHGMVQIAFMLVILHAVQNKELCVSFIIFGKLNVEYSCLEHYTNCKINILTFVKELSAVDSIIVYIIF